MLYRGRFVGRAGRAVCGVLGLFVAMAGGCSLSNPGPSAPSATLNFPTLLALTDASGGAPSHLVVASSNFDLRYRNGSVLSLDLNRLSQVLPDDCEACQVSAVEVLATGGEVRIGSHVSAMEIDVQRGALYLAVRSDADITRIQLDQASGALSCASAGASACSGSGTGSDKSLAGTRGVSLPTDPVAMAIAELSSFGSTHQGRYLFLAHRGGAVSLWLESTNGDSLELLDVLSGLVINLSSLAAHPSTHVLWAPSSVTSLVEQIGVSLDGDSGEPDSATLVHAGRVRVDVNGTASNLRAVSFFDAGQGDQVALLSRSPDLLLTSAATTTDTLLALGGVASLGAGPSRMRVAELGGRTMLFVTSFDAKELQIFDAATGTQLAVVDGLGGPFDVVVDAPRQRAYVADFLTSTVRVISLAPWLQCLSGSGGGAECIPTYLGQVGEPRTSSELL